MKAARPLSTLLARNRNRSPKHVAAPVRKELSMKVGTSLLLLAVSAGLAVLAITGTRPDLDLADRGSPYEDVDTWFV